MPGPPVKTGTDNLSARRRIYETSSVRSRVFGSPLARKPLRLVALRQELP